MPVPLEQSGGGAGGTTLTGTGLARNTGACTELSGDVTTSGSNAATVVKVNGASVPASQAFVGTNSSSQIVAATAGALPSGTTATTQAAGDNSTKVATTAYVDNEALICTTSGIGGFWGGTGNMWVSSSEVITANAGNLTANNTVRVMQFVLRHTQKVGHILFHITTGTTGGVVDVGIYNTAGTLLINAGGVTATGASSVNVAPTQGSVTLAPGIYYYAFCGFQSGGTITAIAFDSLSCGTFLTNSGELNTNGKRWATAANAATAGVLPNTLGVLTTNTTTLYPPLTFFEV